MIRTEEDFETAMLDGANLYGANLDGARNWPSGIDIPAGFKLCAHGCCIVRAEA